MEDSPCISTRLQRITLARYMVYLLCSYTAAVPYHLFAMGRLHPLLAVLAPFALGGYLTFSMRDKFKVSWSYALTLSLLATLLGPFAHWLPKYLFSRPVDMTEWQPLVLHFCLVFVVISDVEWIRLRFDQRDPQAMYPELYSFVSGVHLHAWLETTPEELSMYRGSSFKYFIGVLRHGWKQILKDFVCTVGHVATYCSINTLIQLAIKPRHPYLEWLSAMVGDDVIYATTSVWSKVVGLILIRPVRLGNGYLWDWILKSWAFEKKGESIVKRATTQSLG